MTTEADVFRASMKSCEALQSLLTGTNHQFSSRVAPLNDSSAEYVISTMKHFYDTLVVIQFGIKNTLEDQALSKVTLKINNFETESGLTVKGVIPLAEGDSIKYADQKFVYLICDRSSCSAEYPICKIEQSLSMTIAEVDLDTEEEVGSYEEDYQIDQV